MSDAQATKTRSAVCCKWCGRLDTIQMDQQTKIQVGADGEWECGEALDAVFCCSNTRCTNYRGHSGNTPEQAFTIIKIAVFDD